MVRNPSFGPFSIKAVTLAFLIYGLALIAAPGKATAFETYKNDPWRNAGRLKGEHHEDNTVVLDLRDLAGTTSKERKELASRIVRETVLNHPLVKQALDAASRFAVNEHGVVDYPNVNGTLTLEEKAALAFVYGVGNQIQLETQNDSVPEKKYSDAVKSLRRAKNAYDMSLQDKKNPKWASRYVRAYIDYKIGCLSVDFTESHQEYGTILNLDIILAGGTDKAFFSGAPDNEDTGVSHENGHRLQSPYAPNPTSNDGTRRYLTRLLFERKGIDSFFQTTFIRHWKELNADMYALLDHYRDYWRDKAVGSISWRSGSVAKMPKALSPKTGKPPSEQFLAGSYNNVVALEAFNAFLEAVQEKRWKDVAQTYKSIAKKARGDGVNEKELQIETEKLIEQLNLRGVNGFSWNENGLDKDGPMRLCALFSDALSMNREELAATYAFMFAFKGQAVSELSKETFLAGVDEKLKDVTFVETIMGADTQASGLSEAQTAFLSRTYDIIKKAATHKASATAGRPCLADRFSKWFGIKPLRM